MVLPDSTTQEPRGQILRACLDLAVCDRCEGNREREQEMADRALLDSASLNSMLLLRSIRNSDGSYHQSAGRRHEVAVFPKDCLFDGRGQVKGEATGT